jgi:DNA-binding NtrC family response regulator
MIKPTRKSMVNALSKDYLTFTASNGQEALDTLKENKNVDLVLADIMMPKMNGMELLNKMSSTYIEIVVIMTTALFNADLALEALSNGAYAYLKKPIDLNRLETTIKNALQK